jgi:hypothetical protein
METAILWMEAHQGLASWAQAIGAMIALGIAIWVPAHQHAQATRLMLEQRELEVRNLLSSFAAMADWGDRTFTKYEVVLQQDDVIAKTREKYIPEAHERVGRIFENFPYHNLPSYELTKHAMEVRDAAFFVNTNIHVGATRMIAGTIDIVHFRKFYHQQVELYSDLVQQYHLLMNDYLATSKIMKR